MSFSIGCLGRVTSVQDEVIIEWDEIANRRSLAEAFIAGENAANINRLTTSARWVKLAPGLFMLTVSGDNTGIMISATEEY